MIKRIVFVPFCCLVLFSSCNRNIETQVVLPFPDQKIHLSPSMVINETVFGDAGLLVDEQFVSGEPGYGKGGSPVNTWTPRDIKGSVQISAIIDLGFSHTISRVYVYDGWKKGKITLSTGTPFRWKEQVTYHQNAYNTWQGFRINETARYLRIELNNENAPNEVVIYGRPLLPEKPKPLATKVISQPTFDQFVGINAFIDDPVRLMKVAGFVREYHNWSWDVGEERGSGVNQIKWNPSYGGNHSWYFDSYYRRLKDAGIIVSPCIQENIGLFKGKGFKPVPPGADPLNPDSYRVHGQHLFQYAARYGRSKITKQILKVADDQSPLSGLNLLSYFENWNEPDNYWSTRGNYFTPYEYAAMASADYDGHLGTLGKYCGVKNADPAAKLVMGGISSLNLDYVKCIKFWADEYRKGELPFDVLNFHHYSHSEAKKTGISPETDNLFQKARELVTYRNQHFPQKEVWISEFGYDTHPMSPLRAPATGNYTQEEVQGQWLIRTYLILYAAGIDRAAMYMLRNVNDRNKVKFNTSGLVSSKHTGKIPKPSWYYLYSFKHWLSGMHYKEDRSTEHVKIYMFSGNGKNAYVVWSPTSNSVTIENFKIKLDCNSTKATLVKLANNEKYGDISTLHVRESVIEHTVSESPAIIITNNCNQ